MTMTAQRNGTDAAAARRAMIDSQLRVSGVIEEFVIGAMASTAREDFVPAAARTHAYIDRAIPLGDGHALPAPLVHGLILREAAPRANDRVLLVSCGSGYLAALLTPMVASLDSVPAAEAGAFKRKGGYSLLVIDGAIEQLPAGLIAALADGGRIVTGLAEGAVTRLATGRKVGGVLSLQPVADVGIPVLPEFAKPQSWSF